MSDTITRSRYLWSVDPETGRAWAAHQCGPFYGEWHDWQLPSPWRVEGDGITPSLDCACGAHEFLGPDQRLPWDEFRALSAGSDGEDR